MNTDFTTTAMNRSHFRLLAGAIALVALGFFPVALSAQPDPSIDTSVDRKTIGPGDTISYEVNVSVTGNYEIDMTAQPGLRDFGVLGRSVAPSFRVHNRQAMRSYRVDFRLRAPDQPGTYTISPAEFRVGDNTYKADPVTVEVTGDARQVEPARPDVDRSGERAFLDVSLEPNRDLYVGEQVVLRYNLYINHRERGLRARPPGEAALDDFWVEDLTRDLRLRRSQEQMDGHYWTVTPLRVVSLFPLRAGPTVIESVEVPLARTSLFGQGGQKTIESDEIDLEIQPLPEGAPRGFSPPNVGQWSFEADVESTSARMGGRLTLTARIEGTGRAGRLGAPDLELPDAFRLISTEDDSSSDIRQGRLGGERTFRFHLMPLEEGHFELPPLTFSYFDPDLEEYITKQSKPFAVEIEEGDLPPDLDDEDEVRIQRGQSWAEESPLADLHGLAESNSMSSPNTPVLPGWLFALPLLGLLLLLVEKPLVRPLRRRFSPFFGRRRVQRETAELLQSDTEPVSTRCLRALRHCLNEGLGIAVGALDAEEAQTLLSSVDIPADLREETIELIGALVAHRYAPTSAEATADFEHQTRAVIDALLDWHFDENDGNRPPPGPRSAPTLIAVVVAATALLISASPVEASDTDAPDALDWSELAEEWAGHAAADPTDATAHYNAGTAAAHAGDLGAARLHLERARSLGADSTKLRENLAHVTSAVAAHDPSVSAFPQQGTPAVALHALAPWIIAFALWSAFLLALIHRITGQPTRRSSFLGLLASTLAIAVCTTTLWLYVEHFARTAEIAVITAEEHHLRQAPSEHAAVLTDSHLPPGAVVRTSDSRDDWVVAQLPTGVTGWLPAESLDRIAPR